MSENAAPPSAPSSTPLAPNATPSSPNQGSQQRSTPGPSQSAPQNSANAATEIFEVKVNGKTVKMTRQELIDNASMSHAANEKFNEAKKDRMEVEELKKNAKSDPIKHLMSLGMSKEEARVKVEQWYYQEFIESEQLTPEQKKLKEYEKYFKSKEEEEKLAKEKQAKDEEEKLTHHQREYLQTQIIEALEKSNLPKTKDTVRKIAFYMRQNLINGWEAPMDMIIRQVKNERQSTFRDEIAGSDISQVIELLGEDFVNKLRRHDLEKLRASRSAPPAVESNRPSRAGTGKFDQSGKVSSTDVTRRLRDIRLGKI